MNVLNLNLEFCFTCLKVGAEGDKFVSIDFAPPDELSYKSKLRACVPEMAINNMDNRFLCKPCAAALETAYTFRCMCLRTETRLEELHHTQTRLNNARDKAIKTERIQSAAPIICIDSELPMNSSLNVPTRVQEVEAYMNSAPAAENTVVEDSKIEIVKEELGNLLSESVGGAIDINIQIFDSSESCITEINSDINIFGSADSDCRDKETFLNDMTNKVCRKLTDDEIIERSCQRIPALQNCTPEALNCTVSVEKVTVTSQPVKIKDPKTSITKSVSDGKFWCDVCNKSEYKKSRFVAHILRHSDIKGYKCDRCQKRFYSSDTLYNHRKRFCKYKKNSKHIKMPNVTPSSSKTKNNHSSKTVPSENNLKSKTIDDSNASMQQQLANEIIKADKRTVMSKPVKKKKRTLTERYFRCKLCGYNLSNKQKYKVHLLRHAKDKRFMCSECPQAFYENWELHRHKRIRHSDTLQTTPSKQNEKTKPSTGPKEIASATNETRQISSATLNKNLTKHTNSNHNMKVRKKKKFYCDVCNLEFSSRDHANVHTGAKPYSCKVCSKMFAAYSTVRKHQYTHMKDRKTAEKVKPPRTMYTCDVCKKSFRTKDLLCSHSCRNESGDSVYRCQICKTAFVGRASLIEHMRVHIQEDSTNLEMLEPTLTN